MLRTVKVFVTTPVTVADDAPPDCTDEAAEMLEAVPAAEGGAPSALGSTGVATVPKSTASPSE